MRRNMLNANERQEIDDDIGNWTCEMQSREKDLDEGKGIFANEPCPQPEIRKIKTATKVCQCNNQNIEESIVNVLINLTSHLYFMTIL